MCYMDCKCDYCDHRNSNYKRFRISDMDYDDPFSNFNLDSMKNLFQGENKIMEYKTLKDTVDIMCSTDYKERFIAEYKQLEIRILGLERMLDNWDHNELNFKPTCPRSTYDLQLRAMKDYYAVLQMRAVMENIPLEIK